MRTLTKLLCALCACLTVFAVGFSGSAIAAAAKTADYSEFVKTEPEARSKLYGAPSVILRLKNADSLDFLSSGEYASNVIFTLDENLDVVDTSGRKIGKFYSVFNGVYRFVIPVAEIKTQQVAEAFINEFSSREIADITFMSDDESVLSYLRTAVPYARGIYDCSEKTTLNKAEIVKKSTLSMASVVVLSQKQSDLETVTYFQSRMKTVWTELDDSADAFDVKNAIASGCFGLINTDSSLIFDAYSSYVGGSLNSGEKYVQPSVARYSLNIAHRGLPMSMAENTVEGCRAAVEKGATHIEIDAQFSKDKQIVIMHDGDISRTTDYVSGEKSISNMTLEEIRQYKVCKTSSGYNVTPCEIPVAEDFFIEFKGKPVVFVFEIKNNNPELVAELKKLVVKYDFWDQLTVISFSASVLEEMHRTLPEIPTASLSGFAQNEFEKDSKFYNAINAVADITQGNLNDYVYYENTLKDRGYMSFCWTLGTAQDCRAISANGEFGLTNNVADAYGESVCKIEGKAGQTKLSKKIKKGGDIKIITTAYNGEQTEEKGKIFAVRKFEDYAEVIALYEEVEKVTYTRAFRVDYEKESQPASGGGCGSALSGSSVIPVAAFMLSAVLFVCFKRTFKSQK